MLLFPLLWPRGLLRLVFISSQVGNSQLCLDSSRLMKGMHQSLMVRLSTLSQPLMGSQVKKSTNLILVTWAQIWMKTMHLIGLVMTRQRQLMKELINCSQLSLKGQPMRWSRWIALIQGTTPSLLKLIQMGRLKPIFMVGLTLTKTAPLMKMNVLSWLLLPRMVLLL